MCEVSQCSPVLRVIIVKGLNERRLNKKMSIFMLVGFLHLSVETCNFLFMEFLKGNNTPKTTCLQQHTLLSHYCHTTSASNSFLHHKCDRCRRDAPKQIWPDESHQAR